MGMRTASLFVTMVIVTVLGMGCGGDDGGPKPVASVSITPEKTALEIGHSMEIAATVSGGISEDLIWSVNEVENGNEVYGTITDNSPATYLAPDSLPPVATVVIKAVSVEDTTRMDTCHVTLEFKKIFVDAGVGDNSTGTGCVNMPVKTITHALTLAQGDMTVLVAPGTYDQTNGEAFPIDIPDGVSLVGLDWESCIVRGHHGGDTGYRNSIDVAGNGAVFRKFTVEMGEPAEPRWSLAIHVTGDSTVVDSIRMHERANYSALRSNGTQGGVIENIEFTVEDGTRWDRGFEIVFGNVGTIIRNCSFYGFNESIFFNGETDALVENCLFSYCNYGVNMCCVDDVDSNPNPDLGGGLRGSAGGNVFTDYNTYGLRNPTMNTVYAKFNVWDNDPPVEGEDYISEGSGSIVVE